MNAQLNQLNSLLADGIVFYQKLRHYHWEVQGEHFFRLHEKFEELYGEFNTINDDIAERIMALDGKPVATLGEALQMTSINEESRRIDAPEMVRDLLSDMKGFEKSMSEGIGMADQNSDYGTADLLTGILRSLQKHAWMLRSFLGQMKHSEEQKREHAPVA